jgi:hypothetical protein
MAAMATAKKTQPDAAEMNTSTPRSADEQPSSAEASSAEAATTSTAATVSVDDDLRRRYLEALERKRAGGSAAATGHGADRATTPTSNDKVKRTFRRRAGG